VGVAPASAVVREVVRAVQMWARSTRFPF